MNAAKGAPTAPIYRTPPAVMEAVDTALAVASNYMIKAFHFYGHC